MMKLARVFFGSLLVLSLGFAWLPLAGAQDAAPGEASIPFDTPLAKYKDKEITLGYFITYLGEKLQYLGRLEGEDRGKFLDEQLAQVFLEHFIYDMAIEKGQAEDPEYIRGKKKEEDSWLSYFLIKTQFRDQVKISDEEVQKRYETEKEKYFVPAQFTFWHIFTQTIDLPEEAAAKAKANAEAALALIKAGSDFVEVAELYSESTNKGRIMGPFKPREVDPANAINPTIEDALLKLKAEEVSEIIQTKYGYEILKLKEFNPSHYRGVDEVKPAIERTLYNEKFNAWKEEFLTTHWEKAVTVYKPELLQQAEADPQTVVAEVFGEKITLGNFAPADFQPRTGESSDDQQKRLINRLRGEMIFNQIAAKIARDSKYDTIPRYIYETQKTIIQKAASAWWKKFASEEIAKDPIRDEEIADAYEQYPKFFMKPQLVHAYEMTFPIQAPESDSKYEQYKAQMSTMEKAQKAIERLQKGEAFADVAKEVSQSETAAKGGDLGMIDGSTTLLPRQVISELFKLNPGEFSSVPVKDGEAYYVVLCAEKPEQESLTKDDPEAQPKIEQLVHYLRGKALFEEYSKKLVEPEKIEVLYKDFHTLDPMKVTQVSMDLPQ
ncbi:MAG: peptidyl-prolyl cis-trans isomerase [bacterium]|jgi:parvulin-like peptidyl-prolyl isomerase|nr:peptidyl-prolyl cis-trans isomerase [bacterium]